MNEQAPAYLEILGSVKRYERNKLTRIGTAFPTKDGNGYRLNFDFYPTDPDIDILMLPPRPKQDTEEQ